MATAHCQGPWTYRKIGEVHTLTVWDEEEQAFFDFTSMEQSVLDLIQQDPPPKRILVTYDTANPSHAEAASEVP